MDRIFIQDLRVKGRHGVRAREQATEQEFVINIEAFFDAGKAAASDLLHDTVDYGMLREKARNVVINKSFKLLEKLADVIALELLEDKRIERVSVTVEKPAAYPDCTPGVEIARRK